MREKYLAKSVEGSSYFALKRSHDGRSDVTRREAARVFSTSCLKSESKSSNGDFVNVAWLIQEKLRAYRYIEGSLNRVCRDIHDHHSRVTPAAAQRSKFINRVERRAAVKIVSHPFIRHGSPPAMTPQLERTIIIAVTIRDMCAAKSINPKGERRRDIDRRTDRRSIVSRVAIV